MGYGLKGKSKMKNSQLSNYGVQQMEKRLIGLIKKYGDLEFDRGIHKKESSLYDRIVNKMLDKIIDIIES